MTCVYNEIIAANRADYNKIKSVPSNINSDQTGEIQTNRVTYSDTEYSSNDFS